MVWSEDTKVFFDSLLDSMESLPKPTIRSSSQPIGPEDLEMGRFYNAHQKEGVLILLCLSFAYINNEGIWAVKMIDYPFRHGIEVVLAEVGVVPYRDGTYNQHCWLEATQDKYNKELVVGIRKAMFWEE